MADFYDISEWQDKPHFQTGGTRNKSIFEDPKGGDLFYFKTSLKKNNMDYKHEFWSEILASEIGRELGFNTLEYNIAWHKNEIGCLSKSMVDIDNNELSEGINYLQGYNPNYRPEDKKSYSEYTFHFIENALNVYQLKDQMKHLVTTIIFDSLIGNGDRHQENWGFIIPNLQSKDDKDEKIDMKAEKMKNRLLDSKLFRFFINIPFTKNRKKDINILMDSLKGVFAPIYDSGSCLGRELTDDKVDQMLEDSQMLEAYINRDKCEIRWEKKKMSHFDLIKHIKDETNYKETVNSEIERVIKRFNKESIKIIIENIDEKLPPCLFQYKLPDKRKELIEKFVFFRFEKLTKVLT
jgi:hypothetical protein